MAKHPFQYVVYIAFLGYRFHGWAKQKSVKTVHQMVDKTVAFILETEDFKTLGCSRTDSKVSAHQFAFQLFVNTPIDLDTFLDVFDKNLPSDISALNIHPVADNFNIIKAAKRKVYTYIFCYGNKPIPLASAFMAHFEGDLDLELIKQATSLLKGKHNFKSFCTKPSAHTQFVRTLDECILEENTFLTANFFPDQSYTLTFESSGFMRYQVRLMVAYLIEIGRKNITLMDLTNILKTPSSKPLQKIAPASGLHLKTIHLTK